MTVVGADQPQRVKSPGLLPRLRGGGTRADRRRRIGESPITPYLFILPHFLLFSVFILFPFFFGIWISLHDSTPLREGPFVGLRWYQQLFDPDSILFARFWNTVWNTVIFVLISTPLLVGVGLALAALLNTRIRGRNVFRAIYFVPWTLSVSVISLVWWWMFNSNAGYIAIFFRETLGLDINWLASNPAAWIAILTATLWWTIGFNTIIFLAGMQGISADLYEAASVDGANRWQQFRSITLPSLRPILLLVVTLQIIASFQLVGQPQLMTGGGPPSALGGETTPVLLHVYNIGFQGRRELSIAAAMALVVAAMMVVVSVVNFRLFSSERS
ncbi:MAG TPA: sugar ABC transporter permease [Candidatus Limnocylindrales bacterium]|nr:sugar ABC transporter permease [Candidatus Limnocylindrales bacterium]